MRQPITWSEPVWEENPPAWVNRLFDAMQRADRASRNTCMNCGDHLLGEPCPDRTEVRT